MEILDIPITNVYDTVIGKAEVHEDDYGILVRIRFDTQAGQDLSVGLQAGIIEGLAVSPFIRVPAMERTSEMANHPHIADFDLDPSNRSVSTDEIESRFGFHKATLEGPNATAPRHAYLRNEFKEFAEMLNRVLPPGRYKDRVLDTLEETSMWSHKSIAETAPPAED